VRRITDNQKKQDELASLWANVAGIDSSPMHQLSQATIAYPHLVDMFKGSTFYFSRMVEPRQTQEV